MRVVPARSSARVPPPTMMARTLRHAPVATAVVVGVLSLVVPVRAGAQAVDAAGGAVLGAAGGAVVTLATITLRARSGHFLHRPDYLRWEMAPVAVGAAVGGMMGHRNPPRLWRSVGWGAAGMAIGALAGVTAGRILEGDARGSWTGVLVGGAGGLVVGSLVGALGWESTESHTTPPLLQLRLFLPR